MRKIKNESALMVALEELHNRINLAEERASDDSIERPERMGVACADLFFIKSLINAAMNTYTDES